MKSLGFLHWDGSRSVKQIEEEVVKEIQKHKASQ